MIISPSGTCFNVDPVRSYPKPVQKPHPPLILASHASNGLDRVVCSRDGWFPNTRTHKDLPAVVDDSGAEQKRSVANRVRFRFLSRVLPEMKRCCNNTVSWSRAGGIFVPSEGKATLFPLLDKYAP